LHHRKQHMTKVIFEDELGDGLFYVNSTDVSLGGVFLESDIPVKVGTMLLLSFVLPDHKRPVRVTGQVVRMTARAKETSSGIGVRFLGLSEMAKRRLEEFLNSNSKNP